MEIILADANALKKQILVEGEGVKNDIMAAITVTLTELNVERLVVVLLRTTAYEKQVTMLITPSVINQPLAPSKELKSLFNISLKVY